MTQETKHTPAPWKLHNATNIVGCGAGYDLIDQTEGEDIVHRTFIECIANARLIAAAPDLLEALEALRGACMAKHPSLLEQADKAIARARGESCS